MVSATPGAPRVVVANIHQYMLAFALTDYKLQGRTIPKLILSICDRTHTGRKMNLTSFYVFISRVRTFDGLRLLQHVPSALSELTEMQHNELLIAWDRGYDFSWNVESKSRV